MVKKWLVQEKSLRKCVNIFLNHIVYIEIYIVGIDLCNYLSKSDAKEGASVDISLFAKKVDWLSLKPDIDKVDINKSKTVPNDLESNINKIDVNKLNTVPVELEKKSYVVKMKLLKRQCIVN